MSPLAAPPMSYLSSPVLESSDYSVTLARVGPSSLPLWLERHLRESAQEVVGIAYWYQSHLTCEVGACYCWQAMATSGIRSAGNGLAICVTGTLAVRRYHCVPLLHGTNETMASKCLESQTIEERSAATGDLGDRIPTTVELRRAAERAIEMFPGLAETAREDLKQSHASVDTALSHLRHYLAHLDGVRGAVRTHREPPRYQALSNRLAPSVPVES
jgi:hypothetical protein